MRYRLLIADFDGTLADSFSLFLEHMQLVLQRFKLRPVDLGSLDRLRGISAREVMAEIGLPAWKLPFVARYMRGLMARDVDKIRLFAGTEEFLREAQKSGVALTVVSSNTEANIRGALGSELTGLVSVFECGASLFGKAAKFRKVLKKTGLRAAETLAIGDELRDLEAARAADIDFGAVTWGYAKPESLRQHGPKFLFKDMDELQRVLTASSGHELFSPAIKGIKAT